MSIQRYLLLLVICISLDLGTVTSHAKLDRFMIHSPMDLGPGWRIDDRALLNRFHNETFLKLKENCPTCSTVTKEDLYELVPQETNPARRSCKIGIAYQQGFVKDSKPGESTRMFLEGNRRDELCSLMASGYGFATGMDSAEDVPEAINHYHKASNHNDGEAKFGLGYLYTFRSTGPVNFILGTYWALMSSRLGMNEGFTIASLNLMALMVIVGGPIFLFTILYPFTRILLSFIITDFEI